MKMKWGALVVDGRGKIGGQVASKNRSGAYLRTKVTPVNPQTSSQLGVRNRFTGFSQAWSGLTQAQRDAWNAAVGDFAKTNIFGDIINPTGFNLYQRLNNNLSLAGQAALTLPPLPEAVEQLEATALSVEDATVASSFELTTTGNLSAASGVKVFATPPLSAGKNFVKSEYRLIKVSAAPIASPADLLADYQAKFGSVGVAGQKIFVKVQVVNLNTGQVGTPSQVSTIVVASA